MEITPDLLVLVPIVIALVQILRGVGLPTQFAPVAALVIGVTGAIALTTPSVVAAIQGILVGLSASGLYSGSKTTFKG